MNEHLEESTSKYENPEMYESFTDVNIFFPVSDLLVIPMRNLGLTPIGITLISFLFQLYPVILLNAGKVEYACISSFLGYLFDCVDGNMGWY